MNDKPELWTIRLHCTPDQTTFLEEQMEEEALAVSTLCPPRSETATVEVLVDGKPDQAWVSARMAEISTQVKGTPITFEIEPVGDLDWIKKVAEDFPPLPIARWTVFGAAHRHKIKDHQHALEIDATSAFGTGEHPTTRGCLLLLDELLSTHPEAHHWRMLDMGCGSGILAIAFAKAVQAYALGVDMDPPSVKIAQDNAKANNIATLTQFEVSMGYDLPLINEKAPYDLIMSNIFARPLCEMAGDLKNHLKIGGHVILSGLLNTQAEEVITAHEAQGIHLQKRMDIGEWSILALMA